MTNPFLTPEQFSYRNTKANIEALTGLIGGERGYATDTGKIGYYDGVGADWIWGNGLTFPLAASLGGTGVSNGASASLTLPNVALTLAAAGAYTLTIPATGTAALLSTANVFTALQKINVNSTAALLVEQDGVKDNVLIVDTTNGRVGINGNGANTLNIFDEGKACLAGMYTFTDVSATRSVIIGIKARGTLASPSNIGTNDALFSFVGQGYFDGSNRAAVSIDFDAEGTWATDSYPSAIRFWTNNSTISRTERMRLNAAGNLLIGTTSSVSSGGRLQVVGGVDVKQVVIRAHSTQTANLTDWQNSSGTVQLAIAGNGRDFILDTTTGSKIGTGTTQKLGFWNATPIVRPSAYTQTYSTADKTHAAFTSADIGAFTGGSVGFLDAAERDNIRTQYNALRADVADAKQLINSLIDDLQAIGLVG